MLNVAFYNLPDDADCELVRPGLLRACGERSIMVTDVNTSSIGLIELDSVNVATVPTIIVRADGDVILRIEEVVDEYTFGTLLDAAVRENGLTYV